MAQSKNQTAKKNYIHSELHRDGSLWARGRIVDGKPEGLWKWYRTDGTILRSGYFEKGKQVKKWITYDKDGEIYKVTEMKSGQSGVKRKN